MISIVTPSFRQVEWLRLCVASVADQEGVAREHIIQDGGTEGIAAKEFQIVPRTNYTLELTIEKDAGMYDAVNRGLQRARGEICGYLNCDEQYLPRALETVAAYFARHPEVEVIFGDAILVDSGGRPLSYRRVIRPTLSHVRLAPLNTLTCATFFRRRLIDAGYLFPTHLKIAGDQSWVFRLLKDRVRMGVLQSPLSIFTFTGQNLFESEQAREERFGWLPPGEPVPHALAPWVVTWHRIKKLLAGAYRRRDLSLSIYTQDSPTKRQTISARRVGFDWPTNTRAHA